MNWGQSLHKLGPAPSNLTVFDSDNPDHDGSDLNNPIIPGPDGRVDLDLDGPDILPVLFAYLDAILFVRP